MLVKFWELKLGALSEVLREEVIESCPSPHFGQKLDCFSLFFTHTLNSSYILNMHQTLTSRLYSLVGKQTSRGATALCGECSIWRGRLHDH